MLSGNILNTNVLGLFRLVKLNSRLYCQILTGDFNAEPHENSYACLTGRLDEDNDTATPTQAEKCRLGNPFVDAWLHSELENRADQGSNGNLHNGKDKTSSVERDGYTYPPCNPEKRIDFIMTRNNTINNSLNWKARVLSSRLVGKDTTPETSNINNISC
jgi:endonuclease/exonuclease/phosphatase family metal-dependent hydrolase